MKESEGTEEITTFPLYPYRLQGQQTLPNCKIKVKKIAFGNKEHTKLRKSETGFDWVSSYVVWEVAYTP